MWDIILAAIFIFSLYRYIHSGQYPKNFPPGPRHFIPYIGDLLFSVGVDTAKGFMDNHKKYGPVVGFNFVGTNYVSISDFDILQKTMLTDDYSDRPILEGLNTLRQGVVKEGTCPGIGFSSGHTWRDNRRFTLQVLRDFGYGKIAMEEIIHDEFNQLDAYLEESNGSPVETFELFNLPNLNAVWRILTGERLISDNMKGTRDMKLIDRWFADYSSCFGLLSLTFPSVLKFLETFGIVCLSKGTDLIFSIVDEAVAEHETSFDRDHMRDYIDCFLDKKIFNEEKDDKVEAKQNLRNNMMDMFLASSETTSNTLKWAVLFMSNHPDIQAKVHEEIDKVMINNDTTPSNQLRAKMPYTEAVLFEVQRRGNVVPGSLLHATAKEVRLGSYTLPARTTIVPNLGCVHLNPETFPDPYKFDPERFLDKDGAFVPHPNVIPFGIGKHRCLGEGLAKAELFIFFTRMMHKFTIRPVNPNEQLKTDYRPGLTVCPYPFKVRFILRH